MEPSSSARRPKANRGRLSAGQWQDIRQAARLARSEKVTLVVHGIKVIPAMDSTAGSRQRSGGAAHDSGRAPSATEAAPAEARTNKKTERDVQRAADNRASKRIARWKQMVKRMRYEYIWMPVFTQFMRASMSPKRDARRKIRAALWQEWTRPQFDGGGTSAEPFGEPSPLGLMSHRDRYILRRASSVMAQAFPQGVFGPEDFGSEEQMLQAAIEASLTDTPMENRGDDHIVETRKFNDVGGQTPDSARRGGKKKRGGRAS